MNLKDKARAEGETIESLHQEANEALTGTYKVSAKSKAAQSDVAFRRHSEVLKERLKKALTSRFLSQE